MSVWNHRVLAHDGGTEIYLQVHEVYYDKPDGTPNGYTKEAISVGSEDLKGIKWTLDKMKACLKKPILWAGDKFPQEFNSGKDYETRAKN